MVELEKDNGLKKSSIKMCNLIECSFDPAVFYLSFFIRLDPQLFFVTSCHKMNFKAND